MDLKEIIKKIDKETLEELKNKIIELFTIEEETEEEKAEELPVEREI